MYEVMYLLLAYGSSIDWLVQQCAACPGKGCQVDHGAIRIAKTINGKTGGAEYVEVKEDTGSDVNWIAQETADQLKVRTLEVESDSVFVGLMGVSFLPSRKVQISLTGVSRKTLYGEFLIAPENFPFIGIVVGNPFIRECGHPHTLFPEKRKTGQSLLMMQKKATVRCGNTYKANEFGNNC